MKTLALGIGIVLIATMVSAQWYVSTYGVTNMNELNREQLDMAMSQSLQLKKTGATITGLSGCVALLGVVLYSSGLNQINSTTSYTQGVTTGTNGILLTYTGFLGMAVGIPIWIVGAQRRDAVKVHLVKYESMGYKQPQLGIGMVVTF